MIKAISDTQIDLEASAGYKPPTIESGIAPLPFTDLGDREFELLSYLLVKREIDEGKHPLFTKIVLMQGVGERGRDCILYRNDIVCGVIQCKKITSRISRPVVIKEVIKFLLFYLLDNSLMPTPATHQYHLYAAMDLSEPAAIFLNSHISELDVEVNEGRFDNYVKQVTDDYESFSCFRENPPVDNVLNLFKGLSFSFSNSIDLTARVYNYSNLVSLFFRTVSIVDIEGADRVFRKALDDYGIKYLTDDDLKSVQGRIGNIDKEHRVSLGIADFYGLSRDFFSHMGEEDFKAVLSSIAEVQRLFDRLIINISQKKMNELVLSEITENLLNKGRIHPFSVIIAPPYLIRRIFQETLGKSISNEFKSKDFMRALTKKETLELVITETLNSSNRVMNGDLSHLTGNEDDINFKMRIFERIHQGFSTITDAEKQLRKDLEVLQPILDDIEMRVTKLICPQRTIIINDTAFIDDAEKFKKVINDLISFM
ncbi:hypothetical protein [Kluyvera sp. CRP]|uniref:hypothetical protein n=1 Tax=Kluyvera sp. CRP TaxID=2873269 RepID=UPI001CC1E0B4|nr:hypothetical protein [Kluyvera sp. CRP]UAK20246.1 hypothetical protein K7B04_23825 [Kluyvera sp. CRP]